MDYIKSTVAISGSTKIGEPLVVKLNLLDAFGKPTVDGANQIKFASTIEMADLNLGRISYDDPSPSAFYFGINCTTIGDFPLNVTYRNQHLQGSPVMLSIAPGDLSHKTSRILGFGSWIAELKQSNTFYVQILDQMGHEIISAPTPLSLQYDGKSENTKEGEQEITDETKILNDKIRLKGWNSKREALESLQYVAEYIGKSTWGIRYVINQDQPDVILLGVYFEDVDLPIGGEYLSVYAQAPGFPFPPNSYKLIGPIPAKQEIVEPSASSTSGSPSTLRSFSLDKHGWLPAEFSKLPVTDTDYRAELVGEFHVEEAGVYIMLCLGAEHYNIDFPVLYSGDVWNVHELTQGKHALQVSVLAKRDWNFEFQCRFQKYSPLKSYPSETTVPDIVGGTFMGNLQAVLQNLYTTPLNDMMVRVLAVNNTKVKPQASFVGDVVLHPQELTKVPIKITFSTEEGFGVPTEEFFAIIGFYSPSTKGEAHITVHFRVREDNQPFQFIFEDTDGSSQAAMAIRPAEPCDGPCPVILLSHGGGVDTMKLAEYFPVHTNGWWLFPKGRSVIAYELGPLFESNSLAAIDGLALLASSEEIFSKYPVDIDAIVSVGSHYHGGKGALMIADHNADRILGVSADSGWIRHSEPRLDDFLHPMLSGIIQWSSIHNDFSHTVSNFKAIPFFGGSGYGDTAGYPWRLFYQQTLLANEGVEARSDNTVGLSYKKHPTAVISPTMNVLSFIQGRLARGKALAKQFTVSSTHPAIFQGRGGVHITALTNPTQIASIDVAINGELWIMNTTNTRSFELVDSGIVPRASQILIDGAHSFMIDTQEPAKFVQLDNNQWKEQKQPDLRKMNQYGPVYRMYEQKLTIVCGTKVPTPIIQLYQQYSVYIANELFKQHRVDTTIMSDIQYQTLSAEEKTNIFLIGGPQSNVVAEEILKDTPIPVSFEHGELIIADCHISCEKQAGAVFLAPHGNHVALVVAGSSPSVFESIVHLLPLHSPYDNFPDYAIFDSNHLWKGGNGILSTGYWDSNWKSHPSSTFQACPNYIPHSEDVCNTLW